MGLGLWRVSYFREWLAREGPELGYQLAWRKHWALLQSWDAPRRMPTLPVVVPPGAPRVHLLTGEFHWHLTCFCLYSLLELTGGAFQPVVHDDGSLKPEQRTELSRIIPCIQFVTAPEAEEIVRQHLPSERFPVLHTMRQRLGLMRKLMDVHAGGIGNRLFVDSDVLFYRNPVLLRDWFRTGTRPIYMLDYQDSYGYSAATLQQAYGKPMPQRVNSGITGFDSAAIDWEKLEFWAQILFNAEGVNHFSEQTLTAMLMGEMNGEALPTKEYIISPDRTEIQQPQGVMHHYVVPSRTWYYIDAIPAFVKRVAQANKGS
jgi:hypothetical protein